MCYPPGVDFLLPVSLTAVVLALDAMAVSVAAALTSGRVRHRDALVMAAVFGAFQAGMPLLGAALGSAVRPYVEHVAPLLEGAVLVGLGLYALRRAGGDDAEDEVDFFSPRVLLGLGLATSVDAFVIGIALALGGEPLLPSAIVIGLVTFVLSFLAFRLARRVEGRLGARAERIGGGLLVLLGARAIFEAF